jgi:hypothetical protein
VFSVKSFFVCDIISCKLRLRAPLREEGGFLEGFFGSFHNRKEKKTQEDG